MIEQHIINHNIKVYSITLYHIVRW